MAEYHMDEAVFDVPTGWTDRSLHALTTVVPNSRDRLTLTVSREDPPRGTPLGRHVDRALAEQKRALTSFEILDRADEVDLGGVVATTARVRWRNAQGPIYHRHVYVLVHGRVLAFTGTCKYKHHEACDQEIDAMVATLAIREARP